MPLPNKKTLPTLERLRAEALRREEETACPGAADDSINPLTWAVLAAIVAKDHTTVKKDMAPVPTEPPFSLIGETVGNMSIRVVGWGFGLGWGCWRIKRT